MRVEFYARTYLHERPRHRNVAAYSLPHEVSSVDERDITILRALSLNARMPATELARRLEVSSETIGKRLRRLEDEKIVTGYRVVLNIAKLGLTNWYVLNIEAESHLDYRKLLMELTKQFSDLVKDYVGFLVTDVFKLTLAP